MRAKYRGFPPKHRSPNGHWRRHHFGRSASRQATNAAGRSNDRSPRALANNAAVQRLYSLLDQLPEPETKIGKFVQSDGSEVPALILYAPRTFSFEQNYRQTLGFIYRRQLQGRVRAPLESIKVYVANLSKVAFLGLGAALVLVSDFHRDHLVKKTIPFINDDDWPPHVRASLETLGFYELVRASGRTNTARHKLSSKMEFVRFISAEDVEGARANELIDNLKDAAGRAPKRVAIYGAILEAINNALHHAYPADRPADVIRTLHRWWAAGAFNPNTQELLLAVFDQGVGIPATLPKMPFFTRILQRCPPEVTDADVIAGAIDFGRTSTDMQGRGNGLWTICELVTQLPGSHVRLISGRGQVTYFSDGKVTKVRHPVQFYGTLIEWSLMLPKEDLEV